MYEQLRNARGDARVCVVHAGVEIGIHRDRIVVHRPPPASFQCMWRGEASITLSHGVLRFERCVGSGIDVARLQNGRVVIRSRRGGERIQLAANRPRQALKALLQQADFPVWTRMGLPLLFCDDALAAVPHIGVDAKFAAAEGRQGLQLLWTERS